MEVFIQGLINQITTLCSVKGMTDVGRSILASPIAMVLMIAFIVKFFASSPVKDIEGEHLPFIC